MRLLAFPRPAGQHGRDWVDHPEDPQPEDHGRGAIIVTIIVTISIVNLSHHPLIIITIQVAREFVKLKSEVRDETQQH